MPTASRDPDREGGRDSLTEPSGYTCSYICPTTPSHYGSDPDESRPAIDTPRTIDVVLDTNVWVAGFRSERGASRRIIDLIANGRLQMHLSATLAFEYEKIFVRERRAMGLTRPQVDQLIDVLCALSTWHPVHFRWRHQTPDPADACVLEAAVAAPVGTQLVTFNLRDFQEAASLGVSVLTPGTLLQQLWRKGLL